PITKKTECQSNVCTSQPISGANATSAKYCAELKIAEAVPRSDFGNHPATMRAFAGKDGDSARPTMNRSANSATAADTNVCTPTRPCSAVQIDQTTSATT